MKQQNDKNVFRKANLLVGHIVVLLFFAGSAFSQTFAGQTDTKLLDDFINSKGYSGIISFDSTNIKQFWIDKTVLSQDNLIIISLDNKKSSVPLKIQLANVNISNECKVDVFSDDPNVSFTITNNKLKNLSTSKKEDDFLHYHTLSTVFNFDEAKDYSFNMVFKSTKSGQISIRKIVLSFSNRASYLNSPGVLKATKDNSLVWYSNVIGTEGFTVKGEKTEIWSRNRIRLGNNTLKATAKVKNIGDTPARVYVGYVARSSNGTVLDARYFPYAVNGVPNKTLTVISAEKGSSKITVDSSSAWEKGCYLAVDADDEFKDVPNDNFVEGTISDVKTVKDGSMEITLSTPLANEIKKGTKVRIQGQSGAKIITNSEIIQPGEEETFTSEIRRENDNPVYSSKYFAKGSIYAQPVIFFYSTESKKENTVSINELTVAY